MKRKCIVGVVGIAAIVGSSYATGTVSFLNYFSPTSPTINYNSNPSLVPAGKAGLELGGSFAVELAWYNGTTSNPSLLNLESGSLTYFSFNGPGANSTSDGDTSSGAGWFLGPAPFSLSGSSAGSTVTLDVFAFDGGSITGINSDGTGVYGSGATVAGSSGLFQLTLGGGIIPPASLNGAMPTFTVENLPMAPMREMQGSGIEPVPEPSVFAFALFSGVSFVMSRRKKM
jgi:hypothetical protein